MRCRRTIPRRNFHSFGHKSRRLLLINGSYPFSELEKGDTGYEVTALQTQLAALGYYQKEIVDNFGNGTYNAMRSFETEYSLDVNGVASVDRSTDALQHRYDGARNHRAKRRAAA